MNLRAPMTGGLRGLRQRIPERQVRCDQWRKPTEKRAAATTSRRGGSSTGWTGSRGWLLKTGVVINQSSGAARSEARTRAAGRAKPGP